MIKSRFISLFLLSSVSISYSSHIQSVAAKGKLICNGKPYGNAKIKMYDEDGLFDDFMSETYTNATGQFYLKGSETELTDIDPKINIYHNCNDEENECLRKFTIIIPDEYITYGEVPTKIFDAGELNLDGEMPGESHDCIN